MILVHLFQAASLTPTDISALESSISALEIAISSLEREIKALDGSSVPWEHWLSWATLAVVVGLLMEYWVIWREHRDDWDAFELGFFRLPDKPSTFKYVIELVSVSLITLGVFGEFAIGLQIASINGKLRGKSAELRSMNAELRSDSDRLLALVTQQAGDAAKSVKTAREEADRAKESADAAVADLRVLQSLVSARHIPSNKLPALIKELKLLSGKEVLVVSTNGQPEAESFCRNIVVALQGSGINPLVACGAAGGPSISAGLFVRGKDQSLSGTIAKAIGTAAGTIAVATPANASDLDKRVTILVGPQLPFWIGGK